MWSLLQEFPGWLSVIVALGGAVVSAGNIGRTRWAALLLGGFFADVVAGTFSRLAILGVRHGMTTVVSIGAALFLASLLGLAGRCAVVAGVAGLLSELRGRTGGPGSQPTA